MDRPPLSRFALAMIILAALIGAAAVVLGALAAHGLTEPTRGLADTASRYAFTHALAILFAALFYDRLAPQARWPRRLVALALVLFAAGIVLFSGSLVALAAGLHTSTAPMGGYALIAGWTVLAAGTGGAYLSTSS